MLLSDSESFHRNLHSDICEKILIISKEQDEIYKNDYSVRTEHSKSISLTLLNNILSDSRYYEYTKKLFAGEINVFHTAYIENGNFVFGISLTKIDIYRCLEYLIESRPMLLFANADKMRFERLKTYVSGDRFLEDYGGTDYSIEIDGTVYQISVDEIIEFMRLKDEEFMRFCESDDVEKNGGIRKDHFIYAVHRFFKEKSILYKYTVPWKERIRAIDSFQLVDIQAINEVLETEDINLDKIRVNEELKKYILEGMPEYLNDIEKAIYIYIKLCRVLSYDEEFYAVNQAGEVARKHENIEHITEITPSNNEVVCYEFNAIYGSFLDYLGIKYITEQAMLEGFGGGHASLKFRCGKFLVEADSVPSILDTDMTNAKLNRPLRGLRILNKNEQTREEFNRLVTKIYNLVLLEEQECEEVEVEHEETYDEIIREYKKTTSNYKEVSLDERFDILILKAKDTRVSGVDSFAYVLKLLKILFDDVERMMNISATIVRKNEVGGEGIVAKLCLIFAMNEIGFESDSENNVYYCFSTTRDLVSFTKDELQAKFDENVFQYINYDTPKIPNINIERFTV